MLPDKGGGMERTMIGIGIDTGGTYTDAVVYDCDARKVLCSGKTLTTRDNLELCIARALDGMDQSLVKQAKLLALSTTLATNACLENKGSRARCLMIGMDPDRMRNLEQVYASYGFRDLNQLVFLDGKPGQMFPDEKEPDWNLLSEHCRDWFQDCGAVGVTQVFPQADGGSLENKAAEIIRDTMHFSVTTAYELFDEVDVLRRGAGTLLNARLVPLIAQFLEAVKNVLRERDLDIPIAIVRSDGSLMSEVMTRDVPVETLLSGPAASAIGGSVLAGERDAVIVDMGGTTTDVALIRDGHPVTDKRGISIGQWQTTVQGMYIDTFLLGGDSAVRFRDEKLMLDGRRVIPVSVLASVYPGIADRLHTLAEAERRHTRMLNEFYVLQKYPEHPDRYSDEEMRICGALQKGPLMPEELASILGMDMYTLKTERLEDEGMVMRSGLTPTDMMVIKGDFPVYDPRAALESIRFLAENVKETAGEIPDAIYKMVIRRMYCNLARILLEQKYPKQKRLLRQEGVRTLIESTFEEAYAGRKPEWMDFQIRTDLPIIGVGAPVHIFLPKVAELLGTRAVIGNYAPVANALGAIASRIVTSVQSRVKAEYEGAELKGYSVYEGEIRRMFEDYDEAEAFARRLTAEKVLEKARRQGASGRPEIRTSVHQIRSAAGKSSMFFESIVESVATDSFSVGQ